MRILVGVSIAVIVLLALLGGALFAVKNWGTQELVTAYDVYGTVGPSSIEEMTARSKVVARVRFVSVRAVGQRAPQNYPSSATKDTGYYAALEYTFTVLEYLKGSGGSQVTAYAVGSDVEGFNDDSAIYATTQAKAAKLAEDLLEVRDLRWENREAILFLRHVPAHDYYWLGLLDLERSYRNFTVRSTEFKAWLPDASIPATTTATTTRAAVRSGEGDEPKVEQRFLTEDPGLRPWATTRSAAGSARSGGAGAAPATPVVPSVGLSDLKARIAAVERQIAEVKRTAPGHSAETYSDCIADLHHEISRRKAVGWSYWRTDQAVESGKAGILHSFAIAFRSTPSPVLPEGSGPGQWFEGPDADLIRMEEPGHVVATRPLPAGGYRVFYLARSTAMAICDVYPGSRHDEEYVFTATAPPGTLAESFFDPYAAAGAVTGTTTVGTISWQPPSAGSGQAGRVTADLTVDVTGHALDFIGLDGTTTVSLIVADATESGGTLTWTVPTQPWSAGDKLMLRVRRHDASTPTPTPTPTATPTPTPAPAPTSTPTPIPTDRPVILFLDSLDASVLDSLEMAVGEVFWVSVKALNLESSDSYTIEVSRVNDEPAGGVGIVFHYQACGYTPQSIDVSSGNTSYARTMAVKLCTGTGGTVTAVLKQGDTTLATADLEVSTPP